MASSKHVASSHVGSDGELCDHTLRKVLSWLEVPDLMTSAALVSQRWAAASGCKEVWRRRMHQKVLDALFNSQQHLQNKQRQFQDTVNVTSAAATAAAAAAPTTAAAAPQHEQQPEQLRDPLAAAAAAVVAACMAPARLFAALYGSNLLSNGSFLERLNVHKGLERQLVWEPTYNKRGMTWAHPFDFFPELCPLPEDTAGAVAAKPFSIGCMACATGAWSEITQVVDLQVVLTARGVPADTAAWLLTAGLTLDFSIYVAGGAMAGGEYQVVITLVSAADAAAAANNQIALSALPRMTLPFGHPPPGSAGMEAVCAANLKLLGLKEGSSIISRAPLQPAPGIWSRCTCRTVLPSSSPLSHVVVALRGRASRNSRLGHYATKFADARLTFLPADQC